MNELMPPGISGKSSLVLFAAKPAKDFQYGGFGWVNKDSLRQIGSTFQKLFGFGHGTVLALCS